MQITLQMAQMDRFALRQPFYRDACPFRDYFRDGLCGYGLRFRSGATPSAGMLRTLLQLLNLLVQLLYHCEIFLPYGGELLRFQLSDLFRRRIRILI